MAFLLFLHHQPPIIDDTNDGFFEELALSGYSQEQMDAVMELGLVECERSFGPEDFIEQGGAHVGVGEASFDIFKLTPLGIAAVRDIEPNASIRGADPHPPGDA